MMAASMGGRRGKDVRWLNDARIRVNMPSYLVPLSDVQRKELIRVAETVDADQRPGLLRAVEFARLDYREHRRCVILDAAPSEVGAAVNAVLNSIQELRLTLARTHEILVSAGSSEFWCTLQGHGTTFDDYKRLRDTLDRFMGAIVRDNRRDLRTPRGRPTKDSGEQAFIGALVDAYATACHEDVILDELLAFIRAAAVGLDGLALPKTDDELRRRLCRRRYEPGPRDADTIFDLIGGWVFDPYPAGENTPK